MPLPSPGRIPTADEHAKCSHIVLHRESQLTREEILTLRTVMAGHATGATIQRSTIARAMRIVTELERTPER